MNRESSGEEGAAAGTLAGTAQLFPVRLSSLIFAFAAALIVLFACAMAFVGLRSSEEADRQARNNDLALFDNTLNSRFMLLARDQHALVSWKAYLDQRFPGDTTSSHLDAMIEGLWYQFGHDRTLLIAPDGRLMAYAHEGMVSRDSDALPVDADLRLLVQKAMAGYRAAPGAPAGTLFEAAFQRIEGTPALLSAMVLAEPADASQVTAVLVSVKFIDGDLLEYLNAQLSFNALNFNANPPPDLPRPHRFVTTLSGESLGAFLWADNYPGAAIWSVIWPLILLIGLVMALAAMLVARKLGGMSNVVEHSERRTRHMARHDSLTGLANRLHFGEELKAAVDLLPQPFAVIACDLDRFKAVNDTFGHAAGDTVIRTVAERMRETVGSAGLVSRTGGDEFIVLVRAYADAPALAALGHKLIAAVSAPIALEGGRTTDVGVSLGIAQAPACGDNAASIMRAADEALYEVKATGRGRLVFAGDRLLRQGDLQAGDSHSKSS
ncbi:diguanylate cyclase domain-containing protein [Dongia rigui]|uniref:Diguanylate cyclase n=1 Tax=Dongia rigui TaxID=940149 RepID=A0ABU5DWF1_9PROT|nr:diguanylate cyclase [Dongia rigui]MDY0871543.1 diguanylate cyclase [Dongia rigui]